MTKCIFTGKDAIHRRESWALQKGLIDPDADDLEQIRNNPNVIDGNNSYWSIEHKNNLYSVKRNV